MTNTKLSGQKIDEIIENAISEFAENGKKGASIKTIAEKSGLSVGVIYKYFDSKEALFEAAFERCFKELERGIDVSISSAKSISELASFLLDAIIAYAKKRRSYMNLYFSITQGDKEDSTVLADIIESISAKIYSEFILSGQNNGLIRKDIDAKSLAFFFDSILMMMQLTLSVPYYERRSEIYLGEDFDLDQLKKDLARLLSSALGEENEVRSEF